MPIGHRLCKCSGVQSAAGVPIVPALRPRWSLEKQRVVAAPARCPTRRSRCSRSGPITGVDGAAQPQFHHAQVLPMRALPQLPLLFKAAAGTQLPPTLLIPAQAGSTSPPAVGRQLGTAVQASAAMEPRADSSHDKENQGASQPSPGCRLSPAASAASDSSGGRPSARQAKRPPGQPEPSPLPDNSRKRHRPGSTSVSPAGERETSAEAAARRQLAALSSPTGRPAGGAAAQVRMAVAWALVRSHVCQPSGTGDALLCLIWPPHATRRCRAGPAAALKTSKQQPARLPHQRRRHRRRHTGGLTGRCSRPSARRRMPTRCGQQLPVLTDHPDSAACVLELSECAAGVPEVHCRLAQVSPAAATRFWLVQDPFSLLAGHPLLALACEGQAALLAKVLANGGDVDARDSRGVTGGQHSWSRAVCRVLAATLGQRGGQVAWGYGPVGHRHAPVPYRAPPGRHAAAPTPCQRRPICPPTCRSAAPGQQARAAGVRQSAARGGGTAAVRPARVHPVRPGQAGRAR